MASALHLQPLHRRVVEGLAGRHLPGVEIWAYGSRVNGQSHEGSDLDLVLRGPKLAEIPSSKLGDFQEALQESTLPFLVEARDWARLPKRFHGEIQRNYAVLVSAKGRWRNVMLGDCAVLVRDSITPSTCPDLPYIGLEHIGQGTLSLNGTGSARDVESTKAVFCAGDILFGKLRPYFRKVVRPRFDGICSTDIWVFRPKKAVDAGFLYYLLASSDFVRFASQGAEGTRMPRAKWEQASRFSARLPPVSEQRAIAGILGALDDKIELNRRMAETLDEAVRALFRSWFVDSSEHSAKRNPATLFGDLSEYISLNPESWSATNRPESVAYVDLSNTKWGTIEKIDTYQWSDAPSRARRVVRPGDTIVGTVRPGNGSFALVGKDGLTASTGFAVLRPKEDFDAQFVWCAATSKDNIERLAHLADGGAYPAIPAKAVAATPVVIADISTRRKFSDATAPLVAKYLASSDESRNLADLRDTLLPQLLSGEIRIRDAESVAEAAT